MIDHNNNRKEYYFFVYFKMSKQLVNFEQKHFSEQ